MDIQKEKDAFLNVFQFFKSFKGIGFSEETEQFFLKKNKPNDAECLDVSNLNQMWRAWWARAKSQAVPEGFVLVRNKPVAYMVQNKSWTYQEGDNYFEVKMLKEMPEPVFDGDSYDIEIPLFMIEAQGQSHD